MNVIAQRMPLQDLHLLDPRRFLTVLTTISRLESRSPTTWRETPSSNHWTICWFSQGRDPCLSESCPRLFPGRQPEPALLSSFLSSGNRSAWLEPDTI